MSDFTLPAHVCKLWLVRVTDTAGQVLPPGGFEFYGCATAPRCGAVAMVARVCGDATELVLPGLCAPGAWDFSIFCREVATGVTWEVAGGRLVVTPGLAHGGDAVAPVVDELVGVLDRVTHVLSVALGDSTASAAANARLAVAARAGADEAAARVAEAESRVGASEAVVLNVAEGAALAAERAEDSKRGAEAAAGAAAADAQVAKEKAAEAEASREAAEAEAKLAGARAAEADASAKVAADARDEAVLAKGDAEMAKADAEAAKMEAQTAESNAKASETQAAADKAAAERAKTDAQAAQRSAEEQAGIASAAAEAAQAPESIAAQAARPATMFMLKDGLERLLGSSDVFIVDTDGQKIIVHTDRLADEQLAAVEDMLGRFVPQFIEVERYNHTMEISWREINKYAECRDIYELYAVDPDKHGASTNLGFTRWYTLDLTSDGNFIYPLPKLEALDVAWGSSYFQKVTVEVFKISLPSLTGGNDRLFQSVKAKAIECDLPLVTGFSAGYCHYLRRFVGNTPNVTNWNYAFDYCGSGHNESLDIDCDFSKATTATTMANSCKLNKASVLRICVGEKSIPAYTSGTHNITLGIHIDHQTDEEVLGAIANAEAKGWTLTVQWNGTATAQASVTYGLRKPPIYAKVRESERPDGTVERSLDWGHYVTDPTGYEEFRSEEAAREYYGLPEEDLTETE